MRPLSQSRQPVEAEDGTGDRLREALDRNRELLAIIALCRARPIAMSGARRTDTSAVHQQRALAVLGFPRKTCGEIPGSCWRLFEGARVRLETAMRQPAARVMPIDVESRSARTAAPRGSASSPALRAIEEQSKAIQARKST